MGFEAIWWQDPSLALPEVDTFDAEDTLGAILECSEMDAPIKRFEEILMSSEYAKKRVSVLSFLDLSLRYAVNIEVRRAIEFVVMQMKDPDNDFEAIDHSLKIAKCADPTIEKSSTVSLGDEETVFKAMDEAFSNSSLLRDKVKAPEEDKI